MGKEEISKKVSWEIIVLTLNEINVCVTQALLNLEL